MSSTTDPNKKLEAAKSSIIPKVKQIGQSTANAATKAADFSKTMNEKANQSRLNWLLGDYSDTKKNETDECICGSKIKDRLYQRASQIKWMWVAIFILSLTVIIYYLKYDAFTEPLYDSGIGQRRQVQLDGLGTGPTFNERMQFTQEYQPEYSN